MIVTISTCGRWDDKSGGMHVLGARAVRVYLLAVFCFYRRVGKSRANFRLCLSVLQGLGGISACCTVLWLPVFAHSTHSSPCFFSVSCAPRIRATVVTVP